MTPPAALMLNDFLGAPPPDTDSLDCLNEFLVLDLLDARGPWVAWAG
jgi:hypothetical protein